MPFEAGTRFSAALFGDEPSFAALFDGFGPTPDGRLADAKDAAGFGLGESLFADGANDSDTEFFLGFGGHFWFGCIAHVLSTHGTQKGSTYYGRVSNNKITLTTNDPENPELTLKITGQVIAKISTEPYPLSIPKTQNEVAVGSVLVKTMKETSFQILETKTSGEHVSVELETI